MEILWCITGGGHMLEQSCKTIENLAAKHELTVAFSRAGREVAKAYGYFGRIEKSTDRIFYEEEQEHSSPLACKLGKFYLIVVSPCTANTAAKIALGIADSLVSNIAAQTLKAGKKLVLVPTDMEKHVETMIPSGRKVKLKCREIDLENIELLKKKENIIVIQNPEEVEKFV